MIKTGVNGEIGTLQFNGRHWEVVGLCCKKHAKTISKVYYSAVYPRNQDCAVCGETLVEGKSKEHGQRYGRL